MFQDYTVTSNKRTETVKAFSCESAIMEFEKIYISHDSEKIQSVIAGAALPDAVGFAEWIGENYDRVDMGKHKGKYILKTYENIEYLTAHEVYRYFRNNKF